MLVRAAYLNRQCFGHLLQFLWFQFEIKLFTTGNFGQPSEQLPFPVVLLLL